MTQPKDLGFVKSDAVAHMVAAFIWDAALTAEREPSPNATRLGMVSLAKRTAHEILALHDLKASEILVSPPATDGQQAWAESH